MDYLILGASGVLGSRLMEVLCRTHSVIGTYNTHAFPDGLHCDLGSEQSVKNLLSNVQPRVLIHVAGMTRTEECESSPDEAYVVNVDGIRHILSYFRGHKLVFFSTDSVFDGESAPYDEDSQPAPVNVYGATKVQAEKSLLQAAPYSLVVRVAGLYGWSKLNREFLSRIRQSSPLVCSTDHFSSYTWMDDICRLLSSLEPMTGVVHLVGPGRYSRAEFTQLACRFLALQGEVRSVKGLEAYTGASRKRGSTLVSLRLRTTLTPAPNALRKLHDRLHEEVNLAGYGGNVNG
ncbi:hypothetical protein ES703_106166 [subsurface metagenome]